MIYGFRVRPPRYEPHIWADGTRIPECNDPECCLVDWWDTWLLSLIDRCPT